MFGDFAEACASDIGRYDRSKRCREKSHIAEEYNRNSKCTLGGVKGWNSRHNAESGESRKVVTVMRKLSLFK